MMDAPGEYVRSAELLSHRESKLLVVDVQEKLLPHISVARKLVFNCSRVIRAAKILGVPVRENTSEEPALSFLTPLSGYDVRQWTAGWRKCCEKPAHMCIL